MKPFYCIFYDDTTVYKLIVVAESQEEAFNYTSDKFKGRIIFIEEITRNNAYTVSSKKSFSNFVETLN